MATRTQNRTSKADGLVESIVEDLVQAIEAGADGWQMPWTKLATGDALSPTNAATGRPYRGGNRWTLGLTAMLRGLDGGAWATYRQWQDLGAQVRKGEKAPAAVFVPIERRRTDVDEETGEETEVSWLQFKARAVFHSSQVDGWEPETVELVDHDPLAEAEAMLGRWTTAGMAVVEGGDAAYYDRRSDEVHVPGRRQFGDIAHFYTVVAHEATHWTGPRLGRTMGARFGDDAYAAEELTAELGAAIIAADLGIAPATRDDHAAYLAHWVRILRQDPRHLWVVAGAAEEAVDMLQGMGAEK